MREKPDYPLVDAHAHIFTRDMPLNDNPRHRPAYDFTLQDYLTALDCHGVAFGVIAAASPWSDYNDYTIASVRGNPRLRGTVIVKPEVEKYILEMMKADGIVGVRLPFIGLAETPDLTRFEYRRLLRRIADLDWHVHLHVEGRHLPALLPILENAGVKIVVDHLGRFAAGDGVDSEGFRALLGAIGRGRTWVKASGAYRIGPGAGDILQALLERCGSERLLWASDCPFVGEEGKVSYGQTLDWLFERVPGEADRRRILSSNALAFYGFTR